MSQKQVTNYEFYIEPYLHEITNLVSAGYTEKEIAESHGVGWSSFNRYKQQHPALMEAIRQGKRKSLSDVVSGLLRRATGYTYEEKTVVLQQEPATGRILRQDVRSVKKEMPPDVAAAKLFLQKRDPEHWGETAGKAVARIFAMREENDWSAIRTAQEFEVNGLSIPESLRMEVKLELDSTGGADINPPRLEVLLDDGTRVDLADCDDLA